MKMKALVHASINRLSGINFRIEPCKVSAGHKYKMVPEDIERFVYVVKGSACFYLSNKRFEVHRSDMAYLPSKTAYQSEWHEDSEFVILDLILHDEDGQQICFEDEPGVLFHDTHHAYYGLLEELAAVASANGPFDWLERLSLSFKLLCEMARDTNQTELDEQIRKIKPGITYLEHNFSADFPIAELAKMCCLSIGSFRRIFSECMGMSPVEYRNKLRIQKALELLKTKRYTVGEVAESVGIPDVKYFGKLFKRYTGITPRTIKND
ncbi:MAG: helix-turn-helix transcriptional regulator [Clostridia bacterium]|nr:helix-turn-helix transcriptional regulator [Clostridia bacterium]